VGIFARDRRQSRQFSNHNATMLRSLICAFAACCMVATTSPALADPELRERLRHRMETLHEPGQLVAGGEILLATALLQRIYEARDWEPIWFDDQARPGPLSDQFDNALALAARHGLEPDHYHLHALAELRDLVARDVESSADRRILVDIELLSSDALLALGHDLMHGRVDPETIDPGWNIQREVPDLLERLAEERSDADIDLVQILDGLAPQYPQYRVLLERLALQRELAANGAWPAIASGALLRPGESDPRVRDIRRRLVFLGDLEMGDSPSGNEHGDRYDDALEVGVREFQRRHGLEIDGVVGPRTLAQLNTSPEQRIAQLRANLERWRWLPRDLGEEYILVNIAGFSMSVHSNGETVMTQRVVVGTPYRRTPVFTGRMTYLVLNPSWEVPHRLAVRDQLPRIRNDEDYLERMGFSVLQGWGTEERRIDPEEIDWDALSPRHFPYRLRQAPGPENALGQVKFMFPNHHNVYLHDTPARGLFAHEERALSSGCIRIEDPDRLTRWLLTERAEVLNSEQIRTILDSGRETTVRLNRPLSVHLLYWTAWVNDDDQVQYRRDLYERDSVLIEALDKPAGINGHQSN
jgi:L,D-transpeptidase YcbB